VANVCLQSAKSAAPTWNPVLRTRYDPRSYLYNTDGILFDDMGIPVVLINEHVNNLENLQKPGYHTSRDVYQLMDFSYATALAKTAIQSIAYLSDIVDT